MFKQFGTEANPIDLQILKDQMALITQVREFQEGVRTRIQKNILGITRLLLFSQARLSHFAYQKKIGQAPISIGLYVW